MNISCVSSSVLEANVLRTRTVLETHVKRKLVCFFKDINKKMSAGKTESRTNSGSTPSAVSPEVKKKERPPFKLCFVKQQESGRSDVSICRTTASVLTPKFYSRDSEPCNSSEVCQTVARITEEEQKVPKKVHRWPHLTSHTYGWWHDRGIQPTDPRFNFHKKTSDMVSYQMRIYADDKKVKGLGH